MRDIKFILWVKQFPVSLGDDFDGAVRDFKGGLVVDVSAAKLHHLEEIRIDPFVVF